MPDIDPKSIPVLDDIIDGGDNIKADTDVDDTTGMAIDDPADHLFSPASLLAGSRDDGSLDDDTPGDAAAAADDDAETVTGIEADKEPVIDHAANIAALNGIETTETAARTAPTLETDDAPDTSMETGTQPVIDHSEAISALDASMDASMDASTLQPGIESRLEDQADTRTDLHHDSDDSGSPLTHSTAAIVDQSEPRPVQHDINTAEVTELVIERLMPEIEQRLRVIVDLTLRESLKKHNLNKDDPGQ